MAAVWVSHSGLSYLRRDERLNVARFDPDARPLSANENRVLNRAAPTKIRPRWLKTLTTSDDSDLKRGS